MKRFNWQILLGLFLVALSALFYFIHYALFRDAHHIFIYLVGDIAFVPIEVLLVTLIIHQVLAMREKRSMLEKLNMVIGAFFSEVGSELLWRFAGFDPHSDRIRGTLAVTNDWSAQEFSTASKRIKDYDYRIDCQRANLADLRSFLMERRGFLLRLLENPNMLEHDSFTDLLWAAFHLTEELVRRIDVRHLPDTDYEHLAGDIERTYVLLISEWLEYMRHLKSDYPYLFAFSIRKNPLDQDVSPEAK
jgi:hypothetical protein